MKEQKNAKQMKKTIKHETEPSPLHAYLHKYKTYLATVAVMMVVVTIMQITLQAAKWRYDALERGLKAIFVDTEKESADRRSATLNSTTAQSNHEAAKSTYKAAKLTYEEGSAARIQAEFKKNEDVPPENEWNPTYGPDIVWDYVKRRGIPCDEECKKRRYDLTPEERTVEIARIEDEKTMNSVHEAREYKWKVESEILARKKKEGSLIRKQMDWYGAFFRAMPFS
jgi:hypothetical protein